LNLFAELNSHYCNKEGDSCGAADAASSLDMETACAARPNRTQNRHGKATEGWAIHCLAPGSA
jgi:hypothetical protein